MIHLSLSLHVLATTTAATPSCCPLSANTSSYTCSHPRHPPPSFVVAAAAAAAVLHSTAGEWILNMAEINFIHELDIVRKLAELTPIPSERSIFRVHDRWRNENKNAYEPQVVAIGPYHHGKDNLQPMEEHKLRYLQQLCNRRNEGTVEGYIKAMREFEQKARKFYAEPISLDSNAFVEMMLLDSCFIIERGIFRDLVLFENQLPLFIVEELFNMTNNSTDSLDNLLRTFVGSFDWITPDKSLVGTTSDIKHLLGLLHYCCCYRFHSKVSQTVELEDMPRKSATELHEAGIKFKKIEKIERVEGFDGFMSSTRPVMSYDHCVMCYAHPKKEKKKIWERNLFDIRFVNGTMEIPILEVEDETESVFRNLIAYEQYLPDNTWHHFTAYHKFMDYLVNTSKDVEILTQHGIIRNFLGENEVVATMLNNLGNNTTASYIGYEEVYNKLNEHCRKKWNVWLAILRRDYFNNPWALISFLAAAGLLLLTLLKTIFKEQV
ncbi:unnamed protein product [Camellia sinensis]